MLTSSDAKIRALETYCTCHHILQIEVTLNKNEAVPPLDTLDTLYLYCAHFAHLFTCVIELHGNFAFPW